MIRRALLVASTGGHLDQIRRLASRFTPHFSSMEFATFDDAQSCSLLASETVHFVTRIPPRGLRQAVNDIGPAMRILRRGQFTDVISTGSAIAVPFLAAARLRGVRAHYIESAARAEGPSLTGRLVSRMPGVHLYSQYPSWASATWAYRGSIVDGFRTAPSAKLPGPVHRAVVTFGTMRGYPFERAVAATNRVLAEVGTDDREVLWQIGDAITPVGTGSQHDMIPAADLYAAIDEADLVVAHAGVGSSLRIMESGRAPVLLYRQVRHNEHIDDHQWMIARDFERRGLAISRDPQDFTAEDAIAAMSRQVVTDEARHLFILDEGPRSRGSAALSIS